MRRADLIHLGLLLVSLAMAYVLPFELLLLSYIVLGPAHYFTEISWLHDRSYFMPTRIFAIVLAAAALGGMFIAHPYWSGVLLWCCFLAAGLAALGLSLRRSLMLGVVAATATILMVMAGAPFRIVGILLPTLIHVSIFTLAFMTLGALRSRSPIQFALIGAYLAAIAAIPIAPPSAATVIPVFAKLGQDFFGDIAPSLGRLFGVPDLQFAGRITGLLSFVYTYHYLNWFIKADVTRWANIPRRRLIGVVVLSAASTGLCFYNYTIGITVLLLVSLLHVLLEFPLNTIAIRDLAAMPLGRSARPSTA
ncbi:MAG TPA: hypothetical protein VGF97_00040 [Rhizomicrobium sp.]|jgi:hypothetical protein